MNRVLIYCRGTYGSTLEGKAQLMVGEDDVDSHRTPYLRHSIVVSYGRTINDACQEMSVICYITLSLYTNYSVDTVGSGQPS